MSFQSKISLLTLLTLSIIASPASHASSANGGAAADSSKPAQSVSASKLSVPISSLNPATMKAWGEQSVSSSVGTGFKDVGKAIISPFTAPFAQSPDGLLGAGSGGGGDAVSAEFYAVIQRVYGAVQSICQADQASETLDPDATRACGFVRSALEIGLPLATVVNPRSRNSIKGGGLFHKKTYDAEDEGPIVLLDIDRWKDKQNETDPDKILKARVQQLILALHGPLIVLRAESDGSFGASDVLVQLLLNHQVDLDSLVGKVSQSVSPPSAAASSWQEKLPGNSDGNFLNTGVPIADQFRAVGIRAFTAFNTICEAGNAPFPCNYGSSFQGIDKIMFMEVIELTGRNKIKGPDGKPRDAGNSGMLTGIFLDSDRWMDLQNETNPGKITDARVRQVTLVLHETLVILLHLETDDTYAFSDGMVDLLMKNGVDFDALVGKPLQK